MTLEELQEQVDKDLKINESELDLESLKTPQIHNKYLKHYNNFKLLMTRAESDYKILKRVKWEYYTGKASPKVYQEKPFNLKIMKSDLDKYLDSDEDLIKSKHKVEYHNAMCDYAERVCKSVNNRGFQIKNAIDWKRFLEGSF